MSRPYGLIFARSGGSVAGGPAGEYHEHAHQISMGAIIADAIGSAPA
jgi:hypothetical protein